MKLKNSTTAAEQRFTSRYYIIHADNHDGEIHRIADKIIIQYYIIYYKAVGVPNFNTKPLDRIRKSF